MSNYFFFPRKFFFFFFLQKEFIFFEIIDFILGIPAAIKPEFGGLMKWLVRGGECHGECHTKLTGKKRKERSGKEGISDVSIGLEKQVVI